MDRLKEYVYRIIYPTGVSPLPTVVCLVIFGGQVLNSCIATLPYPFLPKMMQSFGFEEVEIGYYAGWVATSIFICNILASLVWGILVDKYGSKHCCIASSLCAAVTTVLFGLSYNYNWAFWSRFSQGVSNGWLVAAKAMLYDLTDNTNQSYAMAIISTAFACGLIVGPGIGGYLAMPSEQYPSVFAKGSLFDKFKFLLPNLIVAAATVVVSVLIIFLVPDTRNITGKHLRTKDLPNESVCAAPLYDQGRGNDDYWKVSTSPCQESLGVEPVADQGCAGSGSKEKSSACVSPRPITVKSALYRAAQNKDLWMTCMLYTFFMLPTFGFPEIFSLWALTSKEYHGLGYTTSQTGAQLLVVGCAMVFIFPIVSTRLVRVWGAKKVMVRCALLLVLVYSMYPTTWLIPDSVWLALVLTILQILSQIATNICFTSVNIFQNNSVPSDLVGLANGLGLTVSSIGRAISPALFGGLFSWSLKNIKDLYPDGLGYPFDQSFTFILFSLTCVIIAAWVGYFPDYLDWRREWPKEASSESDVESGTSSY